MTAHTKTEILRLLGTKEADEALSSLLAWCEEELDRAAQPKSCSLRLPVRQARDGVWLGDLLVPGQSLAAHLNGCREAVLFAATLGAQVDRMALRLGKTDIAKAAVWQAASAVRIEDYCDACQQALETALKPENLHTLPRFSPGYGDMPLTLQPMLLSLLDAPRRIGLLCTKTQMLTPAKSVTAVLGLTAQQTHCLAHGCDCCGKTDCAFRRTQTQEH